MYSLSAHFPAYYTAIYQIINGHEILIGVEILDRVKRNSVV